MLYLCTSCSPLLFIRIPYSKPAGRHRLCTKSGHGEWRPLRMHVNGECHWCTSQTPNRNRTQFSLTCTGLLSPWHFPKYVMVKGDKGQWPQVSAREIPMEQGKKIHSGRGWAQDTLCREAAESPSLKISKRQPEKAQTNLIELLI